MKDEAVDTIARTLFRAHDDVLTIGREPPHDFDGTIEGAGWRAVARTAIELGARLRGTKPPREHLDTLLGADSTNFLGTGLTLREFTEQGLAEKMAASWPNQPREERRRRLDAVMRLSVELTRIRETAEFSTRLAEMAIESVIEGDWKMVEEWAEHFSFEAEREASRLKQAPVFAIFRELLLQVLRAERGVPA